MWKLSEIYESEDFKKISCEKQEKGRSMKLKPHEVLIPRALDHWMIENEMFDELEKESEEKPWCYKVKVL